ncbi:NmrA family NAD(P)-binding protein [Variovorax boronicumulans]|uniref:NmrA family NAD(P)-binding protein n=1 Tax=Variovorax boronicumulans TaxID=436515 RepID=UPI001C587B87
MHAITGITGQVGGVVARRLLAEGQDVRAVVRDPAKAQAWAQQGCEVATADAGDAKALTQAFAGTEAVFVLLPPNFDPSPDLAESRAIVAALHAALAAARPSRVVCLSTVGAHQPRANLLSQLSHMEQVLGELPMPIAFVRAAWFMENAQWDVASARDQGVVPSFLQPLERAIPMVATADVGRVCAELMATTWTGRRVIELAGPQPVSPQDIAAAFARLLGHAVQAQPVPRDSWEALFRSQGMHHPLPRMQMLDGFNEGWIAFAEAGTEHRTGEIGLDTVLRGLIERSAV